MRLPLFPLLIPAVVTILISACGGNNDSGDHHRKVHNDKKHDRIDSLITNNIDTALHLTDTSENAAQHVRITLTPMDSGMYERGADHSSWRTPDEHACWASNDYTKCIDSLYKSYRNADSASWSQPDSSMLVLKKISGDTVQFRNHITEDDSYERYDFRCRLAHTPWLVLDISYYEGSGYLMFNQKTGEKKYVENIPVVSTAGNYAAAANCDVDAGFTENGITIFRLDTAGTLTEVYRNLPNYWGPEEIKWVDDATLLIRQSVTTGLDFTFEHRWAILKIRKF